MEFSFPKYSICSWKVAAHAKDIEERHRSYATAGVPCGVAAPERFQRGLTSQADIVALTSQTNLTAARSPKA